MLKYFCCCCYCYVFKDEFDQSMGTKLRTWTASFTLHAHTASSKSIPTFSPDTTTVSDKEDDEGDNLDVIVSPMSISDMDVLKEGDDGLITRRNDETIGSLVVGTQHNEDDDNFISDLAEKDL